jgi:hypothetical protein
MSALAEASEPAILRWCKTTGISALPTPVLPGQGGRI